MATYRFIGDVALVHIDGRDISLTEFGQTVDLADDQAKLEVSQRVPLLSEAEWKKIGITDAELDSYPTNIEQRLAPAAFLIKKQKALDLFVAKVIALFQPVPVVAPVAPAPTPAPVEQVAPESTQDPKPQESK